MDVVREIRSLSELNAGLPARSISHFLTEISGLYSEDYVDVIIIIYFFKKKVYIEVDAERSTRPPC